MKIKYEVMLDVVLDTENEDEAASKISDALEKISDDCNIISCEGEKNITNEHCPECEDDVKLPNKLDVYQCPTCAKYIVNCSMCEDMKCSSCELENKANRLNGECKHIEVRTGEEGNYLWCFGKKKEIVAEEDCSECKYFDKK